MFLFPNSQQSPHQVAAVIDSISDYNLDPGRFSVSTVRPPWATLDFLAGYETKVLSTLEI